ncbi:K02A2.6-like [Cordylochernes scorpioides]|uniref:K02A2.6-like n=1 Tax=Cordylochernes scorpioides TaxID=51811 RepID=A0ABY6KQR0_9ARAC|nr:K02A2.6-like [Cordylochernes scorpioides]
MGRMILVLVDAYSKWHSQSFILKDITSKTIINNGKQFVSVEFEHFTKLVYGTLKPVRIILAQINNGKDDLETNLQRFLFAHREFPQTVTMESPAELLMKRSLRSRYSNLIPKMGNPREVFHEAVRRQEKFTTGCEVYFRNYATGPELKKRHINQLRPVRNKLVETRNFTLPRTSGEKPVGESQKESEEEVPEVTSGNEEEPVAVRVPSFTPRPETAAVQVSSCSPRPEIAAVQVPSCSPRPETAAVQVPIRSPRPQRAKKPPDRLVYILLDPVWISWNKVRPRLTRAISPKPWSLGGRFSVCQS